ncbi:MAG: ThuA domain-containing protein [Chloroflexi bacterium]|nr:ThuA domain-containing protein [Chloroflexota bacterium]
MISSGIFHPPLVGRLHLWRGLAAPPGVRLHHAGSIEALVGVKPGAFSAIVLYYHCKTLSPAALAALDRFARAGGGILAMHSATASFKNDPAYFDILGGRFTGHPPVGRVEIRPVSEADEVFGAIAPFTVTDEAYRHDLRDDIRVHFVARCEETGDGQLPLVWTRRHDAGRVCYVGPGHRAASLRHPCMVSILQRGLAWVCGAGGEVAP